MIPGFFDNFVFRLGFLTPKYITYVTTNPIRVLLPGSAYGKDDKSTFVSQSKENKV